MRRWIALAAIVVVLLAIIMLPSGIRWAGRTFNKGPESRVVHVEFGSRAVHPIYDIEHVELVLDDNCTWGRDSSGVVRLLVFSGGESISDLDEVGLRNTVHWPRDQREDVDNVPIFGTATSGDLVAVARDWNQWDIRRWTTRPHRSCRYSEMASVLGSELPPTAVSLAAIPDPSPRQGSQARE